MSSSQSLPQELLVEILSRVPVKDLMRFRCVSKLWNSLIFDPTLVKLHLQRSSKNTHILLTFEDCKDKSKYCAPCSIHGLLENPSSIIDGCHPFNHGYTVLGVCNGLVCLLDSYRLRDEFVELWVRFWNPATRVISQDSPRIHFPLEGYKYRYSFMFGFGYDDWSDTYKVVLVLKDIKSETVEVRIHCLGDTCWRNILTCSAFLIPRPRVASVSGTVNCLALPNLSSNWQTIAINDFVIFSFDLKNETYRYLSMPDGLIEVPSILQVLKGCLCLSHHHGRTHFSFWLMREFGVEKSWTHLLNISYEQLHIHANFPGFPPLIPMILCMSQNDILLLADGGRGEFILYNKKDNRIDRYGGFDKGRFEFLSYDYAQSLVMPY